MKDVPATVQLILEEDEYETKLGDGRFLYPKTAYLDTASAVSRVQELTASNKGIVYTVKSVEIEREEAKDRLVTDLDLDPCEHVTLKDVVRLLSDRASPHG